MANRLTPVERRSLLLRLFADRPELMGAPLSSTLFEAAVGCGYDRSGNTLVRDMAALRDWVLGADHAAWMRARDALIVDAEIRRVLADETRPLEPLTRLIEARAKLHGYLNTPAVGASPMVRRNKYAEADARWAVGANGNGNGNGNGAVGL